MTYVLLIVGFALLIKGADFFVEGASKIASLLRVSPLLIGLTIVAFGTSSPEATVSILAALDGSAEVSLGNVIGSNIFNITLVVGITALINPLKVESATIRKEIPFTLLGSMVLLVVISDIALQGFSSNLITRSDGFIFLLIFTVFMYYIFEVARNNREQLDTEETTEKSSWGKNAIKTLLGLAAIIFGGEMVVRNSTEIAISLGMSETLVGLTIVAVGTSLPELVTSITAAIKKQSEIALGNIVGSNIFNILFVLGTSSVITPLPVNDKIFMDIFIMLFLTVVLLIFSRTRYCIGKIEGSILAISYVLYLIFIIIRN
ncbi:calcium/sodium antiporter [Bacillus tianshenii]|uniref:calcium/sodium antiporter n=1 Tax=Sutcliffiella tianshenii TaxID=1463404 RepID=UPI001CD4542D|nr:calcium/sodium antiporter [Bacillus tianshenii]MCA1321206.1 calcium/sodium antiporter [Bacillus tianshenii]